MNLADPRIHRLQAQVAEQALQLQILAQAVDTLQKAVLQLMGKPT